MRLLLPVALITALLGPRAASAQGDSLGPEFRVNTYTTGFQSGPSIAVDSSGAVVVVWGGSDGGDPTGGIFGQRYTPMFPVDLMSLGVE